MVSTQATQVHGNTNTPQADLINEEGQALPILVGHLCSRMHRHTRLSAPQHAVDVPAMVTGGSATQAARASLPAPGHTIACSASARWNEQDCGGATMHSIARTTFSNTLLATPLMMSAATNTASTSFVRADIAGAAGFGASREMSGDAGDLMSGLDSPSGRGSSLVVMVAGVVG